MIVVPPSDEVIVRDVQERLIAGGGGTSANTLGIITPITQTTRTERSRYLILLRFSPFLINLIRAWEADVLPVWTNSAQFEF